MRLKFKNPQFAKDIHQSKLFSKEKLTEVSLIMEEGKCYPEDFEELAKLKHLEHLYVDHDGTVNFAFFSPLTQLCDLHVGTMDCAYCIPAVINLRALQSLTRLESLEIRDFINIDVDGIGTLTQLKELFITFGGRIHHIEQIAELPFLRYLSLCDTIHKNLDFLQLLSPDVELDLNFVEVEEDIDIRIIQRFTNRSCEDITINGKTYEKI